MQPLCHSCERNNHDYFSKVSELVKGGLCHLLRVPHLEHPLQGIANEVQSKFFVFNITGHQCSLCSPSVAAWEAFPSIVLCLFQQSGFLVGFPHFLSAFTVFSLLFYTWLVRNRKIWALWRGSQVGWKWEVAFAVFVYCLGTTSWKFPISTRLLTYVLSLLKKIVIK